MAGHSKWANIQHRKGRQDKQRASLFSKLSKEITVAAKMGDIDVDKNPRLRLAVKAAKSNSMPKDAIERAIGKAMAQDLESYDEVRYEGYSPGGVAVIVETLTDNRNRTAAAVRSIFAKAGGNLAETGAVLFMFEHKGLVVYPLSVADGDTVLEAAIEAGAEDVGREGDTYEIYCEAGELHAVSTALEVTLGESLSTVLLWKPTTFNNLDLDIAQNLLKLVNRLEDDDDVQVVTTNAYFSDEIMLML